MGHPVGGPRLRPDVKPGPWTEALKERAANDLFASHVRNFLDCIKSRERPLADVEDGHRTVTACHLANISLRLGRKVRWDPDKEEIVGDREASAHLVRPYRKPWDQVLRGLGPMTRRSFLAGIAATMPRVVRPGMARGRGLFPETTTFDGPKASPTSQATGVPPRTTMGISIYSFPYRRPKSAYEFLKYCYSLGAGGVQAELTSFEAEYTKKVRQCARNSWACI